MKFIIERDGKDIKVDEVKTKTEQYFVDAKGRKQGEYKKFRANGALHIRKNYIDNKLDSFEKFERGEPVQTISYVKGKKHIETGKNYEIQYKNGKPHYMEKTDRWHITKTEYEKGKPKIEKEFFKNKEAPQLVKVTFWDSKKKKVIKYGQNSRDQSVITTIVSDHSGQYTHSIMVKIGKDETYTCEYKDNKPYDGIIHDFNTNWDKVKFKNGLAVEKWDNFNKRHELNTYDENGQLFKTIKTYIEGGQTDDFNIKAIIFYRKEKQVYYKKYVDGIRRSIIHNSSNGIKEFTYDLEGNADIREFFDENQFMYKRQRFIDGKCDTETFKKPLKQYQERMVPQLMATLIGSSAGAGNQMSIDEAKTKAEEIAKTIKFNEDYDSDYIHHPRMMLRRF